MSKQKKPKKPRNLGRAYLGGKLRDAGLSRRKSLQFLNTTLHLGEIGVVGRRRFLKFLDCSSRRFSYKNR